ncbi:MAG: DMT family transporter [Erythrobacter sp.]|uniref:DMT family transporter n=1 Tax=Erythrobacter sp. TaxID=1042 RepID=UPI0026374286|nr:DMT family transporter [Erythrobacter sp.]MDJ0979292.1 DMT family transporter [Erythrobacter sp.]
MTAISPPISRLAPFAAAAVGVGFLSLMDAFMKEAALAAGAYSVTVLRSLIGAAIIAPFWLARREKWPERATMKLHIERGIISAFMALSFFYAITTMPLAEAIAISFIAPIVALFLARALLGEVIRPSAYWASALGFVGTLIIIGGKFGIGQQAANEVSDDYLWGLAAMGFSALLYAYNFIVIRKQSQVAGPVEIATFHSGVGGLVLLLFAPFFWDTPDTAALQSVAAAGVLTVAGAMAIAWAYARAETQALVPIEYSGFLWASLFGWLFFREEVTIPTLIGAALIVTGCWIATRKAA